MPGASLQADVSARVKAQYEAYPYPHYALGLPLRVQEGYASHSRFAARLLAQYPGQVPALTRMAKPRLLIAGCGDTFPYVLSHWEPRHHQIMALDISHANLRRARMRCMLGPVLQPLALSSAAWRRIEWRQGNLEADDMAWPAQGEHAFAHIDCFGVLHHLAHPAEVLRRFAAALLPGGTARFMVYNGAARKWLRHLQKALRLLGLSPQNPDDIVTAKKLLSNLMEISPALAARLGPMRGQALAHDARFVDTFMHAREARLDLKAWLSAISDAGLTVIGLFDRNGELDDLPNPLEAMPDSAAMQARLDDRRFENDFEFYVARIDLTRLKPSLLVNERPTHSLLPAKIGLTPPASWFSYVETRDLPWLTRYRLWRHFLAGLNGARPSQSFDAFAAQLPAPSLQRLARVGAIFRSDFASQELQAICKAPLHETMEPPDTLHSIPLRHNQDFARQILRILGDKQKQEPLFELIMRRLDSAQSL